MAKTLSHDELLPLVDALADGQWHSGEGLAQAAGVSRAALAKRVGKLADWGLVVESQAGRGYRLGTPLERLSLQGIIDMLPGHWQRAAGVQVLTVTDSTNSRLLESSTENDPQAAFAELQTAGRGRLGRAWRSPFGANLYLSVAWSFPAWPERLTTLPLAIGTALANWLHGIGVQDIAVKWPNDLWIARRKLGGILIETRGEAGGGCRVVVGVGVNLAMRGGQAQGIDQPWIALSEALPEMPPRNALAAALLVALLQTLETFQNEGFAPFREHFPRYDATLDTAVNVSCDPPVSGIARGVDAAGALIVDTPQGQRKIMAGDVSLRLA